MMRLKHLTRSLFSIRLLRNHSKRTGKKISQSLNFEYAAKSLPKDPVRLECFAKHGSAQRNVSRETGGYKSGAFTLIEVLVAMVILTSTIYVMSDLHIRSMFRLLRERDQFLKFFAVKNGLVQQLPILRKEFKPSKNLVEDDTMANPLTIAVDVVEPNPKSPLKDILGDQLALVQATGTWKNGPFDYDIRLVSFAEREVPLEAKKP